MHVQEAKNPVEVEKCCTYKSSFWNLLTTHTSGYNHIHHLSSLFYPCPSCARLPTPSITIPADNRPTCNTINSINVCYLNCNTKIRIIICKLVKALLLVELKFLFLISFFPQNMYSQRFFTFFLKR